MKRFLIGLPVLAVFVLNSPGQDRQGGSDEKDFGQKRFSATTGILGAFGKEAALLEEILVKKP